LISLVLLLAACAGSGPQSALEPEGPIADDINDLWLLVFWVATGVFVIVEAGLVYAVWKFRERKDDDRMPRQSHGNTALEITWTIIPAVILAVLTVPMLDGLFDMRRTPTDNVLHINVTGHQWWWEFEYVDERAPDGRTIVTANELHIPAGRDVYLTMSSGDVIHSFWVPKLNGKRDVVRRRSDTAEPASSRPMRRILRSCARGHEGPCLRARRRRIRGLGGRPTRAEYRRRTGVGHLQRGVHRMPSGDPRPGWRDPGGRP
jgi:cytochrome c oxidase subunit 2